MSELFLIFPSRILSLIDSATFFSTKFSVALHNSHFDSLWGNFIP